MPAHPIHVTMKYLIVNADDFGASRGVNRGIIQAHRHGILTSTSLLVSTDWSEQAAGLSREAPELSVGLHVDVRNDSRPQSQLDHQLVRFQELMGRLPTHLDSHHNVHRDPRLLPLFLDVARQLRLPLREHSPVRYFSKFYGWWGGKTRPEQISVESLVRMLEKEIGDGITELSCHPGYIDADFSSGYAAERETELQTLCDPVLREVLVGQSIQLVNYHNHGTLAADLPT